MRRPDVAVQSAVVVVTALMLLGSIVRFLYHYTLFTGQMTRFLWY